MSSSLIVEVCVVEEVKRHPNADLVELIRVKNWWTVAGKGAFTPGDKCVYVPPDSVIPEELAERWGIKKYCPLLPKQCDGLRLPGCRVKAQRFRGEGSFGTVQKPDDPDWPVGLSVIDHYGITKYEPPTRASDGDAAPPVSAFHHYTSIENINNFPNVFEEGEEVVISEKIHGMSGRVGLIFRPDSETGDYVWVFMAGSHAVNRREYNPKGVRSIFWSPLAREEPCMMRNLLRTVQENLGARSGVIVFGEIFGPGVQDMAYGQKGISFRIFDIDVDGKYLDYDPMMCYCNAFPTLPVVPYLYRGPFSLEKVAELTDGPTTLCPPELAGKFKGREGVVIRPVKERYSKNLPNFGRVVLKSVSVLYHERKNGTEYH